jgi:hypothetical protein
MTDDLAAACLDLARAVKWIRQPIDASEITVLADRLEAIALSRVREELRIDPPLLARAVRYISHAHGMPWGEDTLWFEYILDTLIEVARPNTESSGQPFLHDMLNGIQGSLGAQRVS